MERIDKNNKSSQRKWSVVINGDSALATLTIAVKHAGIMEQFDKFVCGAEGLKNTLSELDSSNIKDATSMMWSFIEEQRNKNSSSSLFEKHADDFFHIFSITEVVLIRQFTYIIRTRAKELGLDPDSVF